MDGSRRISLEEMPFYKSMMKVQEKLKLEPDALLAWQLGFKATPDRCTCGHEWSAFDLMLEGANTGHHGWDFYRENSNSRMPIAFRESSSALTCPNCGAHSAKLRLMYNYATQCGTCG